MTVQRVISADGTSIAWERVGEGPPLILVDAAGAFRGFGPSVSLARELAGGLMAIAYDRRGRGDSTDTLPYAVEREVEDLAALIDAAGGRAAVYGFSSGAILALIAAAAGLPISRLVLMEPPLDLDSPLLGEPDPLEVEVAGLVAAGRRGDAVEHFHRGIGVPEEYLVGMRDGPDWPVWERLAHTLVYDCVVGRSLPPDQLRQIETPALVLASTGSDERLRSWAAGVAGALPNGRLAMLEGEWHGVPEEDLARAIGSFLGA
jgi:pimeloyl-ACP methyl ester carboxylesterase